MATMMNWYNVMDNMSVCSSCLMYKICCGFASVLRKGNFQSLIYNLVCEGWKLTLSYLCKFSTAVNVQTSENFLSSPYWFLSSNIVIVIVSENYCKTWYNHFARSWRVSRSSPSGQYIRTRRDHKVWTARPISVQQILWP